MSKDEKWSIPHKFLDNNLDSFIQLIKQPKEGEMITKIATTKIKPIHLKKGDSITVLYYGKESNGKTIKLNHVLKEEDAGIVDVAGVFKFTNFLDCTSGLGGYFGRSKDGN